MIVIDDGSIDDTAQVVARYPTVRLISHAKNQGKSRAVATGVGAARHELLMLLDADLKGLRAADLDLLAGPVLEGRAAVGMSLRRNSLAIFRGLGIDFVSGERVVGKSVLAEALQDLHALPRFGVEVFMNRRIIAARLPIAIANWRQVSQSRKTEKLGRWRGVLAEWRMVLDLLRAVGPLELLTQTVRLSALRTPGRSHELSRSTSIEDVFDLAVSRKPESRIRPRCCRATITRHAHDDETMDRHAPPLRPAARNTPRPRDGASMRVRSVWISDLHLGHARLPGRCTAGFPEAGRLRPAVPGRRTSSTAGNCAAPGTGRRRTTTSSRSCCARRARARA